MITFRRAQSMEQGDADLIGAFYQAAVEPTAWSDVLARLQTRFDAHAAILGIYDPASQQLSLSFSSGAWTKDVMDSYASDFVKVDPAVPKFARQPAGKATTSEQLLTTAERRNGVFYHDFLKPLGVADVLGARLLDIPRGYSALAIHSGGKREPFDLAEIAALERLVPHATRAFQLFRTFVLLDQKMTVLASMVDRLAVGLIARDREDNPLHTNHAALAMVARKDGLRQDADGQLRANNRAADSHLVTLQRAVYRGGAGGIVRVPREHSHHAYAVLVAPLPAGTGLAGAIGEGRSGMLILIHDPDRKTPTPVQTLAAMFGLTIRGAELAAALAAGEDLNEFADRTGISMHTVRFHLKGLFATLGVRSQSQLVRLTVRALAEFSLARDGRQF
jgi:DNA-binding CsgD family transcriptional regulator